jgi:protein-S-isoprenylcysteine O-methyltransferase Ste14
MFAVGWFLVVLALRTNAFATTVVRHQQERGHQVVSTGIYRYVRHPMYSGLVLSMVGMGLWLGSYAGATASLVPTSILVIRICVEEKLLRKNLADYSSYASLVRFRLIPGVW